MVHLELIDRIVERILWIQPMTTLDQSLPSDRPAQRAFGFSLLISALRCTLQYLLLPVILPLIGITSGAALPLIILLDLLALWLLFGSLRFFWSTHHPRRFHLLPLAVLVLLLIITSLSYDLWRLGA